MDSASIARLNRQRLTGAPQPHGFLPREKGGLACRTCIHGQDHPVHTVQVGTNVVMLGARRPRR